MSLRKNYELRENNKAFIIGEIVSELKPSHTVFGENFYLVDVRVKRLSDNEDIIPIMASERIIDTSKEHIGTFVQVDGQWRSYNKQENGKNRLQLYLFAEALEYVKANAEVNYNEVFLDGCICKKPVFRTTPLGRDIADVLIAVNRPYGKSDYIPCVCWGRNAKFVAELKVGTHLNVRGRIQSRLYNKYLNNGQVEERTAYEISVNKLEVVTDEKN